MLPGYSSPTLQPLHLPREVPDLGGLGTIL
jgi:hypothetical protein